MSQGRFSLPSFCGKQPIIFSVKSLFSLNIPINYKPTLFFLKFRPFLFQWFFLEKNFQWCILNCNSTGLLRVFFLSFNNYFHFKQIKFWLILFFSNCWHYNTTFIAYFNIFNKCILHFFNLVQLKIFYIRLSISQFICPLCRISPTPPFNSLKFKAFLASFR